MSRYYNKISKTIGSKYVNRDNKIFEVIGYIENDVRGRIIKFESGYTRRITTRSIYNGTNIVDIYTATKLYGIAIADIENSSKHFLYDRWCNMIGRCYSPKHRQYKHYGEKGVQVEEYLLKLSNYINFIESLPNYDKLRENPKLYQIDKDIKTNRKANMYSRETISIVTTSENLEEENIRKRIKIYQYNLEGVCINEFNSISEAERVTGIHRGNIARNVRKQSKSAGGYIWTSEKLDLKECANNGIF